MNTNRSRVGIGFLLSLLWTGVDWLGREETLGQLGVTIKPHSAAAQAMAVIESVPPIAIAAFTVGLGLACIFYPLLRSLWRTWFPKYPIFESTLWEFQESDPAPVGPDLWLAIVMTISNRGAPSSVRAFKVEVQAVNGATLTADVFANGSFSLVFNGGTLGVTYLPEHYIMNRTHDKPIVNGTPVTGILPCVIRGVTSMNAINGKSLKVLFADGTGDSKGQVKWWEATMPQFTTSQVVVPKTRPGLPSILPIAKGNVTFKFQDGPNKK